MPSFSKSQEMIDTALWEQERIIDEQSRTTKLCASMLNKVAGRLLKAQDPDFDLNRFNFLVFDDKDVNAFYLDAEHSKDGRHIVAVSAGLINECRSEDEFAAIIGHELGHFTKKQTLGKSSNSVFEEQSADMWSVNLLYDAGYNPRAMVDISGRIFDSGKKNNLFNEIFSSIGVHGSSQGRLENINTALTALKQQKGEFKDTPGDSWKDFQKMFNQAWRIDGYTSYLDQVFTNKFGHHNYAKIPLHQTVELLNEELDAGRLNNTARLDNMIDIIRQSSLGNLVKRVRNYFNPFTKRDEIQNLAEHYLNWQKKDAGVEKFADLNKEVKREVFSRLQDLTFILGTHPATNEGIKFQPFGEFAQTDSRLQRFIVAPDFTTAAGTAAEIKDDVIDYAANNLQNIIDFSNFETTKLKEKIAVGQKLPWHKHLQWRERDENISTLLEYAFDIHPDTGMLIYHETLHRTKPDFAIFADKDGKIIAVGDEAKRLHDEKDKRKMTEHERRFIMERSEKFYAKLDVLNHFAAYNQGNLSAEDLITYLSDFYAEHAPRNGMSEIEKQNTKEFKFENIVDCLLDYRHDDFMGAEHLAALQESPAYAEFMAGDAFVEDFIKRHQHRSDFGSSAINALSSISINRTFLDKIMAVSFKYMDETKQRPDNVIYKKHIYALAAQSLENALKEDDDAVSRAREKGQEINRAYEVYQQQMRRYFINHTQENYLVYDINCGVLDIIGEIHSAVVSGKPMPYRQEICARLNAEEPTDFNSLNLLLSKFRGRMDGYHAPILAHDFVWNFLQNPQNKITDLKALVEVLPKAEDVNNCNFDYYRKLLGNHISQNKLFPTSNIYDDVMIYEAMTEKSLFSADLANREKFLNNIIERFSELKAEDREKYAFNLLTQQYMTTGTNAYNRDRTLPYAEAKDRLMNIWVDEVVGRLGKDDGSAEYLEKVKHVIAGFDIELGNNWQKRKALMAADKNKILRRLSDKVVSKQALSEFLGGQCVTPVSAKDMEKNDIYGRSFEAMMSFLRHKPEKCDLTIKFLNTKLTPKSVKEFQKNVSAGYKWHGDGLFNTENIEIMHKTFWSENLEVRAVVMNKLLNRYSEDTDKQIEYVCDMHFTKNDPYRKDADLIFKTVINSFEPFERGLILSAMASANENRDDEHQNASKSVGKGLAMFFENMGPAWVKFGQLLSYVPDLPSEIREHLGKLKDKANIPPRWEIYKSVNETLPAELAANIKDVGKILGAGSFWVTAEVQFYDEKTGKTEPKVLSLLRPYAVEKFSAGDKIILDSVKKLGKADPKYQQLSKIAEQASISGRLETDVNFGFRQLCRARKIYGGLEVFVNDASMKPEVADWLYYGTGRNGCAYKLMDKAVGDNLNSDKHSLADKRSMAMAYTTVELTNLLRGEVWDTDRHSGQQNFQTLRENGMKKFIVGIFDTGAQMQKKPNNKDKILLGELLYGMVRAARNGNDITDYMFKKIKKLDKLNRFHIDTGYIAEVQRGLTALSDIMEYQKEIKDKEGNIIQERKILNAEDMQHIATAILESGLMDKSIKRTLTLKAVLNKFRPLRKGWASSLLEGLKKTEINSVGISYQMQEAASRGQRYDKPETEIRNIEQQERSRQILGIDKQRIARDSRLSAAQIKNLAGQNRRRA